MSTRVISFHYTLKDSKGEVIDSSDGSDPLYFMEGSGQIIPGLETEILKMNAGQSAQVEVSPEQGYGIRDEDLIAKVPRSQVPKKDVQVGEHFQVSMGDDERIVTVTEVTDETVTLDANHPLAGQKLFFDVKIVEIRPATAEEKSHGHAHGPGGHHHH